MSNSIKEIEGVPFDEWKLHGWLNVWQRFKLWFIDFKYHRENLRVCKYKKLGDIIVVYEFYDAPPDHYNCRHRFFINDN